MSNLEQPAEKQYEAAKSGLGEYLTDPGYERYNLMIPQLPRDTILNMYSALKQVEAGTTGVVDKRALLISIFDAIQTGLEKKTTGNQAVNAFTVEGLP